MNLNEFITVLVFGLLVAAGTVFAVASNQVDNINATYWLLLTVGAMIAIAGWRIQK